MNQKKHISGLKVIVLPQLACSSEPSTRFRHRLPPCPALSFPGGSAHRQRRAARRALLVTFCRESRRVTVEGHLHGKAAAKRRKVRTGGQVDKRDSRNWNPAYSTLSHKTIANE